MQSRFMENQRASENLEVIRTLMERASIYRRALAPIMTLAGLVGVAGATLPCFMEIGTLRGFSLYWMTVSLVGLVVSYMLVRRQAFQAEEPFWSPPTKRVTQALGPSFFVGLIAGLGVLVAGPRWESMAWLLALTWVLCYGCGLHAAGFFMVRGIKLFGWMFVVAGSGYWVAAVMEGNLRTTEAAHYLMGTMFGVLQLAYGIYLYFTEKRDPKA